MSNIAHPFSRAQDEVNQQQLELDRWRQQVQDTRSQQQQQNTASGANNSRDSSANSISRKKLL